MKIGDKICLWGTEYNPNYYKVLHEINVTIIEEKIVPDMWTGKLDCKGYCGIDDKGRKFYLNWNSFPSDSMTPQHYWGTFIWKDSGEIIETNSQKWKDYEKENNTGKESNMLRLEDAESCLKFSFKPHKYADGSLAWPKMLNKCNKHEDYPNGYPYKDKCFKCELDVMRKANSDKDSVKQAI